MDCKLVVVGGAHTKEVRLKLPAVLGRGREAQLTLPHPLVSRLHCELFEQDGIVRVRDLGSLNGTFVANERITEAALPPGELLTVGSVTFRAVYEPTRPLDVDPKAQTKPAPGTETVADIGRTVTVGEDFAVPPNEATSTRLPPPAKAEPAPQAESSPIPDPAAPAQPAETGPLQAGPIEAGPMDPGPMDPGPMDPGPMDSEAAAADPPMAIPLNPPGGEPPAATDETPPPEEGDDDLNDFLRGLK